MFDLQFFSLLMQSVFHWSLDSSVTPLCVRYFLLVYCYSHISKTSINKVNGWVCTSSRSILGRFYVKFCWIWLLLSFYSNSQEQTNHVIVVISICDSFTQPPGLFRPHNTHKFRKYLSSISFAFRVIREVTSQKSCTSDEVF